MSTNENFISNFEDDLDLFNEGFEEVLNEDTLYFSNSDKKLTLKLHGDGLTDRVYGKDPYIKLYKGKSKKPFCRVGFKDGKFKYIDHNNFENGRLKDTYMDSFIEIINGKCNTGKFKGMDVWDAMLQSASDHTDNKEDKERILSYHKPDDFEKEILRSL